jgi:two-component system chemotaxis response regulator CheB
MDIELPGMTGLDAVGRIMSTNPVPILVLSSLVGERSDAAAAALAAGALDALSKDDLDLRDPAGEAADAFRRRLVLLSGARVIRHPRVRMHSAEPEIRANGRPVRGIGICASIGGPQALATVLGSLPASFPIPVLVVQHIATGFCEGLARWLGTTVALPVRLAEHGVHAEPGIWLAPEKAHLRLEASGTLVLDRDTVDGPHRPSGDVLLGSLASSLRREAVSVVLTGMGRDGAAGSQAVREAGGLTIAQDESTSIVFGMPKEAAERGVDLVLPLDRIGPELHAIGMREAVG